MARDLTIRQKRFCDEYIKTGNATQSYYKAGYKGKGMAATVTASKLLINPNIANYIEKRNKEISNSRIADMQEVQEYWTGVFRNPEEKTQDRLKATEYIAKTHAAFVDKVLTKEAKDMLEFLNGVTPDDLRELAKYGEDEDEAE